MALEMHLRSSLQWCTSLPFQGVSGREVQHLYMYVCVSDGVIDTRLLHFDFNSLTGSLLGDRQSGCLVMFVISFVCLP